MNRKNIIFWIIALLLPALAACGEDEKPAALLYPAGAYSWVDAPLPGSVLALGPIEIVAHAADPSGVASFIVNINGKPLGSANRDPGSLEPNMAYTRVIWQPQAPGRYLIEVNALSDSGQAGPPAVVEVTVGGAVSTSPTVVRTANTTATATASPTPPITLTASPTGTPCDLAVFAGDVSVPDGTVFPPGKSFRKAWRVVNAGSCAWTPDYRIAFISGDQLGAPLNQELGREVLPGHSIDISVPMQAPAQPGTYTGYWKLRNPQGALFSFADGSALSVQIEVRKPTATPTPKRGCTVRETGRGIVCKVPCPPGARPGLPCTP